MPQRKGESMRKSWKIFIKYAEWKGFTPIFLYHECNLFDKNPFMKEVWGLKEKAGIEAIKPRQAGKYSIIK